MPVWFQRVENAVIALAAVVAVVRLDIAWWWLAALFLIFDLSMVGYARSAALGALTYNLGHSYIGPVLLGIAAVVTDSRGALIIALAWIFHIGVDRLLGYGLKFTDRFTHTHLGEIGPGPRPAAGEH